MGFERENGLSRQIIEDANEREGLMNRDEAWKILQKVNAEFRGNTIDIPLEAYDEYYQAAVSYVAIAERAAKNAAPGTLENDSTYALAQRVITEAPAEAQAA